MSKQVVLSAGIASATFVMWRLLSKRCVSSVSSASDVSKLLKKYDNHLILHFDINKTIVMADAVQGKSVKGVVNDTIAECSWGTVHDVNSNDIPSNYNYNKSFIINNTIWKPLQPYTITPYKPNDNDSNIVSFMSWVKSSYPYPDGKTDPILKAKRRSYTTKFVELFNDSVNEISENYINTYNTMLNKMENGDGGKPVFIIPAFWNCIHDLIEAKRSFSIVFRTFGTDLKDVEEEFNKFCVKHGYDGSKLESEGIPDLLLDNDHIGVIHCDKENGKSLIIGVNKRNPMDRTKEIKNMKLEEFEKLDRMKWYQEQKEAEDSLKIICNEQHVYDYIKNESLKHKTMMFSDDYVWWSMHGENSDGGKMFVLNDNDKDIHQIFFDDNLEFDRSGIVDVRKLNINNGNDCVSDSQWIDLKNKHLLKVEPLNVMLNDDYFTEHIIKFESALSQTK